MRRIVEGVSASTLHRTKRSSFKGAGMWFVEDSKFQRGLKKSLKRKREIEALYAKELSDARRNGVPPDAIRQIEHRMHWEVELVDDEMSWATSQYWVEKANRYQTPLPDADTDGWEGSHQLNVTYLSRKGVAQVRADVRAERKATWEYWQQRLTLVLGVAGSIFGGLAYFRK